MNNRIERRKRRDECEDNKRKEALYSLWLMYRGTFMLLNDMMSSYSLFDLTCFIFEILFTRNVEIVYLHGKKQVYSLKKHIFFIPSHFLMKNRLMLLLDHPCKGFFEIHQLLCNAKGGFSIESIEDCFFFKDKGLSYLVKITVCLTEKCED